jgi:hypothetical protein
MKKAMPVTAVAAAPAPAPAVAAAAPKVRRTSPRLAASGYTAARAAKEARFAAFRTAVASILEASLKKMTAALQERIDKATASGKAEDITAVMSFILVEPRMPELFAAGSHTLKTMTIRKAREFLSHKSATEELRTLCRKVLDKYGPKTRAEEFDYGFLDRWILVKKLTDPTERRVLVAALVRWVFDYPLRVTEASAVVREIIRSLVTSVTDEFPPSHWLICKAVLEEMTTA